MRGLGSSQRVDDGRLLAGVLEQHEALAVERPIRPRLPPVILDELLGDRSHRDSQRTIGRERALEAQVGERIQQRELVGRDEVAFVEQTLELAEELELGDRRLAHFAVSFQ